ncbi:MAG: DASH family cryptochrome, partial [Luteibaculum sp.]
MKRGIYWFRNNLRLADNPSFAQACEECDQLLLIYIWEDYRLGEHELGFPLQSKQRSQFITESLSELHESLVEYNQSLHQFLGNPLEIISELAEDLGIANIYCTRESGYYEQLQEQQLAAKFKLHSFSDQLLLNRLPFPDYKFPKGFSSFRKKVEKNLQIRPSIDKPRLQEKIDLANVQNGAPNLGERQIHPKTAFPWRSGENAGQQRLQDYIWETQQIKRYKFTRNGLLGKDYSTKFSPFLAVGNISPVQIYWQVKAFENEVESNISTYWVLFELLWREFFHWQSRIHGSKFFQAGGIQDKALELKPNPKLFWKWAKGQTGNDFIDANMRELNETGFMSNRGRQNAASYLAHNLKQPWWWGAAYFESL